MDVDGSGAAASIGQRGHRSGDGAGAAGAGLPHPTFDDAHVDRTRLRQRRHHLQIHARGEHLRIHLGHSGQVQPGQAIGVEPGQHAREMRVAHVHAHARVAARTQKRRRRTQHHRRAHVDGDGGPVAGDVVKRHDLAPRPRAHPQRGHLLGQAGREQMMREDADAVAAHLGDGAVGVAVVHEPVVGADLVGPPGMRQRVEDPRLHQRTGAGDPQQPVAADARTAIAQGRDQGFGQVEGGVGIGDDDEIVLRAVALDEGDGSGGGGSGVAGLRSMRVRAHWRDATPPMLPSR